MSMSGPSLPSLRSDISSISLSDGCVPLSLFAKTNNDPAAKNATKPRLTYPTGPRPLGLTGVGVLLVLLLLSSLVVEFGVGLLEGAIDVDEGELVGVAVGLTEGIPVWP